MTDEVFKWQQDFAGQSKIYWVTGSTGYPTGNFYDSEEAARLEVDWIKRVDKRTAVISSSCIHDLDLAKRRWVKP